MDEDRILKTLASAAGGDQPPLVDVADRVLATIAVPRAANNVVLWAYTGLSSLAAAAAVLVALWVTAVRQDPVGDFLEDIAAVMKQHPADVARLLPVLRRLPGPVVYVEHGGAA